MRNAKRLSTFRAKVHVTPAKKTPDFLKPKFIKVFRAMWAERFYVIVLCEFDHILPLVIVCTEVIYEQRVVRTGKHLGDPFLGFLTRCLFD